MRPTAESIGDTLRQAFPDLKIRPTREEIEAVMRPLAPQSYLLRRRIRDLIGFEIGALEIDHWMEANQIVLGNGRQSKYAREFSLADPCTCFVPYLEDAMRRSRRLVDPRLHDLVPRGNDC